MNDLARSVMEEAVTVTVERPGIGSYDEHGRWNAPMPTELQFLVAVQQTQGRDLVELPGGRRTTEQITLYSVDLLYGVAEGGQPRQPDIVIWQGRRYEVHTVHDRRHDGGYIKAIAVKEDTED